MWQWLHVRAAGTVEWSSCRVCYIMHTALKRIDRKFYYPVDLLLLRRSEYSISGRIL